MLQLLTVEGLGSTLDKLDVVQDAIARYNGSQCGSVPIIPKSLIPSIKQPIYKIIVFQDKHVLEKYKNHADIFLRRILLGGGLIV